MTLRWNKPLLIAYRNTFLSQDGQKVLADLTKKCPLLKEGVKTTGGVDVNQLLVQEGYSSVIKYIYKMLRKDPNAEVVEAAVNEVKIEGI